VTLPQPVAATAILAEIAEDLVRAVLRSHPEERAISLLAISVSHIEEQPVIQLDLPLGLPDEARRPGAHQSFQDDEPSTWSEDPAHLPEAGVDVAPVVHRRDRPHHSGAAVGEGKRFGGALHVADADPSRQGPSDTQHHPRRIHAGDGSTLVRGGSSSPCSHSRDPAVPAGGP